MGYGALVSVRRLERPGISLTRLLITAAVVENRPVDHVRRPAQRLPSWLYELLAH
jgi:hypothetical protein